MPNCTYPSPWYWVRRHQESVWEVACKYTDDHWMYAGRDDDRDSVPPAVVGINIPMPNN